MEAIAHNKAFAKKVGVPQSVGKDFSNADKGKTFRKGGLQMNKMDPKMMAAMMAARKKPMMQPGMAQPGTPPMMKKGGGVKKMADGGETSGGAYTGSRLNMPSNTRLGKLNARDTKEFNKAENSEYGKELSKAREAGIVPRMTKEAKAGYGSDTMPGSEYKKGGNVKKMAKGGMARGGGIEVRGKTKGAMVKMNMGGMAMKKMTKGGRAC